MNVFENFNEDDEEWLSELENVTVDSPDGPFDWREAEAGELADADFASRRRQGMLRAQPQRAQARRAGTQRARVQRARVQRARVQRSGSMPRPDLAADELYPDDEDDLTGVMEDGGWPGWPLADPVTWADTGRRGRAQPGRRSRPETGRRGRPETSGRAAPTGQRTQALIDGGRRSARQGKKRPSGGMLLLGALLAVIVAVAAMVIFRPSPGWPPSVATVQKEITTACQNPNVASEPGQVNFTCGKDTSQILWVFALVTSGNNVQYSDAKTGREGLEPITATQGGEVAWSLDLHHPYNPYDPVDSLEVAARALNNIIGGATLTGTNGKPVVQQGLEGNPQNCAKYTGSSAVVAHAGYPSLCAQRVSTTTGQAALVADAFREWMVGATAAEAYDVGVLFANANNPGNPQVQAILKGLPQSA